MKIKNTIVLIAIAVLGTITTQAKSNINPQTNYIQVQKQDPPEKDPFYFFDMYDDFGGIILDFNPPIYEPPYPPYTGK